MSMHEFSADLFEVCEKITIKNISLGAELAKIKNKNKQMRDALKICDKIYWGLIAGDNGVEIAERAQELHDAVTAALAEDKEGK